MAMLGKGSFRDVPFLIENEQGQDGGRRIVTHEYPLRDDGLTEDLGMRLRNYLVSCLVIGDDHIKQAEKLIEALEKPDVGTLKHPYFGTKEVRVMDYKAIHSTAHQRVTRFEINFVPAVGEIAPKAQKDTLFSALNGYANAINVLSDEVANLIEQALAFADEMMDNPLFHFANDVLNLVESVFERADALLNHSSDFKANILSFKGRLNHLIREPKLLVRALLDLVRFGIHGDVLTAGYSSQSAVNFKRAFIQAISMHQTLFYYQGQLNKTNAEVSKNTLDGFTQHRLTKQATATVLLRKLNYDTEHDSLNKRQDISERLITKTQFVLVRFMSAVVSLEYGKAIAESISQSVALQRNRVQNNESATLSHIESKSDVTRYMKEIDMQLEQLILDYADHEQWDGYTALNDFRLALSADLRTRGEQLANAKQVILRDTQPALVVAHNYANNSQQWAKICLRNNIRHPLFCLGGEQMEILQ